MESEIIMVKSLDKKWKEFLFAFSGFGPNFLMILMGSYYSDALNPAALESGEQFQALVPGVCFILPALFPILYALAKIFDGIIDIPFAHITDTLSTKWGRRRPAIAVCLLPMIISFICCWIPVGGAENPLLNTIWISVFIFIFFASYTMCLIAFYGSLSTVCTDEPQRLRVSSYKSFFDTISYCLVYALVPVILSGTGMQIGTLVFASIPLMLTMIIPLVLIKEGEKYGYPENRGMVSEKISIGESITLTFKNRVFRNWLYVNACTFFGLQMFLSAMNGLIIGGMGLNGFHMAIFNTCAFGLVPIMLYLFNKSKRRFGVRATYQSCLLVFAAAILTFFIGSRFILGEGNVPVKMAIGITGGMLASWSIGAFFMMPYLAPAQISSIEEKLTGKNHSAMYFAGNAVVSSIVGAISGNLIYEYLKNVFFVRGHGLVWLSSDALSTSTLPTASDLAYQTAYGVWVESEVATNVYNFANLIVPFIVLVTCVLGYFVAFKLPRDFTPTIVAEEFKKLDPTLDISSVKDDEVKEEKGEILFVQIGLSILSGFIFGFIWLTFLMKSIKEFRPSLKRAIPFALSCLIPFASIPVALKLRKEILAAAEENGVDVKISAPALIASSLVLPMLFMNVISLALLQRGVNKIYSETDR